MPDNDELTSLFLPLISRLNVIKMRAGHPIELLMILCAMGAVGVSGCGGSAGDVDRPDTFPVSGTVKYNGAPIEGASVMFVARGEGHSAAGFTDASGKYSLTTFAANDGAVPGKYGVKIVKMAQPEAPAAAAPADPGYESAIEEDAGYEPQAIDAEQEPKNLLPAKYADATTSGLSFEVVAGENPPADFDLQ